MAQSFSHFLKQSIANQPGSEIVGYQVIVENEGEFNISLPDDATQVTVPPEFLESETEHKFEVLAIEESGSQTITEDEFTTSPQ